MIGNQTNDLGLVINNDPLNTGNSLETTISFIVYSGTALTEINTRSLTEINIENTLSSNFHLYKSLQANIRSGFQYNHYYNLTVCACLTEYQAKSCISKILGIYKPAISAVIAGLISLVSTSDSLVLNGALSSIPLETDEKVSFTWQCISCYSLVTASSCDCLVIPETKASPRIYTTSANNLTASCKYNHRLTITSQSGAFVRTSSVTAMFITYSGTLSAPEELYMEIKTIFILLLL